MGGNGSYSKQLGGVPRASRTHIDTEFRIDGHKVVVLGKNPTHNKFIMNSNSESPIYLFASVDETTHKVTVSGIGIYDKHILTKSIDLKFDNKGHVLPYSDSEKGSHSHLWYEKSPGVFGRKSHDKSNYYPVDKQYHSLIQKVEEFNNKGKIWNTDQKSLKGR